MKTSGLKRLQPVSDVEGAYEQDTTGPSEKVVQAPLTSQGRAVKSRRVVGSSRRIHTTYNMLPRRPAVTPSAPRTQPLALPSPTYCSKCCAKKFAFETKHFCCDDGRVRLARNDWPPELIRLYTSLEEDALHFQKYARIYNNLFAFSSIAGGIDASTKKVATTNRGIRRTMVSCREYYTCKFQIRDGDHLLRTCRLLQQFLADVYVKIENTRLDFFRLNQKLIRAELYQGILDCLEIGENNANNIGRRVVLPPTFIGGPRDMKRRYLNAMALVQKYGKPDIFLTMTCNPKWKEIQDELSPGEKAKNIPDLIARIFRAKLMVLKKKIIDEGFFGPIAGMIYVVEFQKRGLPHVHFLLILERGFKIKSPEQFDKFVCAEILPEDQPYLRSLVLKHMMHGPCGPMFPDCPCMQKKGNVKKCRSKYPKKHVEVTTNNSDGYPLYRRRNNGDRVEVRRFDMDN